MGKRRVYSTIQVTYDSSIDQVKTAVHRIKAYLKDHPDIHQETIVVTFDDFKADGAEIMIYFFTKTTEWEEYLSIEEEMNKTVMDRIDKEEVRIARPCRCYYTGHHDTTTERVYNLCNVYIHHLNIN